MKNDSSSCTSDLSRVSSSGSCSDHIVLPPDKNSQLKQRQFEKREYCEQRVGEDIHNPECFKISFFSAQETDFTQAGGGSVHAGLVSRSPCGHANQSSMTR